MTMNTHLRIHDRHSAHDGASSTATGWLVGDCFRAWLRTGYLVSTHLAGEEFSPTHPTHSDKSVETFRDQPVLDGISGPTIQTTFVFIHSFIHNDKDKDKNDDIRSERYVLQISEFTWQWRNVSYPSPFGR